MNITNNSTTSNSTTGQFANDSNFLNCFSIYDDVVYVSNMNRAIIVILYFVIFIINIITNGFSIYVNIITGHWKNQSMRIILYISISDILNGVLGNAAHVVHILIPNQLDCQQRRFLILIPHMFSYFSTYSVFFLGLDRFLHVMLLSRYKAIIKPARFNSLMVFYLLVGIWQAIITTFGPKFFGESGGARYSAPINNLFIIVTVVSYVACIIKLRLYAKTSRVVSANTLSLNKLATAFLIIITVTHTPVILSTVIANAIKRSMGNANTNILAHCLLLLAKTNSSLNAIAYLRLNAKARRRVNAIIQKIII